MSMIVIQQLLFILILIGLSIPLGIYLYNIMIGKSVFKNKTGNRLEGRLFKVMGVKAEEMTAKKYAISVLLFSIVGLFFVFIVQLAQRFLPFNPENIEGTSLDLAFNTAASFVSNTNWQAYSGETGLSYFTQSIGLTVQNFVSAASGIAVLFVLIRGFILKQKHTVGNFWVDLTRITLYVLMPLSIVGAIILVSQGVVQSFSGYQAVTTLQDGAAQTIPLGPAASQIMIKQLGTNGGGFFGSNSAFPLENPTALSNLIQLLSILLIPAALCVTFGKAVKNHKQGRTIYIAMMTIFILTLVVTTISEAYGVPLFSGATGLGNMEGKEVVHGIGMSSLWATATTAASNGSVNSMHNSYTAFGGMMLMFLMQIGEIVFGGVGSGLYGIIAFVLLTVFIAGLMVGRTPEYLSKKIEPFDMKMVCLIVLVPPVLTLIGTAIAVVAPGAQELVTNEGARGFSEILYAYSSMGNNNGSAFAGFSADNPLTNLLGGSIMLMSRFIPLVATIFLAGNMAKKKSIAVSEGTLSTTSNLFIGLLVGVILIIAALSFLPSLALGPIADYFTSH
ncbi:potassium-transporting ATPase subunit KdpA [Marinilactibacillus kalidii]|uniref:potassium-transporting ATPase subunit KdpA n=1 Tax=Marinilactibacillus kalidii TaxID=2820274 RepID=UPI001ABE1919|nr:potassium-transporting ATPase subunit KdpA [Marinilactibacillus kalidii]